MPADSSGRTRCASGPRCARAAWCRTCIRRASARIARRSTRSSCSFRRSRCTTSSRSVATGRRQPCGRAVFDIDSVQLAHHIAELRAQHRHALLHLVRGLAVQVPARGPALSVSQARKEDRRRRRHGDHAGRLGCDEVRRAEEVSRRARHQDAGARQRLRVEPPRRRAHGHRQPAGVLGVRRARRRR